jgi:hypothetical protein
MMRLPRVQFTLRRWMLAVLFVAAILAVRNELARMRTRQIETETEQIARALANFRYRHGAGWNCRISLAAEPSSPRP